MNRTSWRRLAASAHGRGRRRPHRPGAARGRPDGARHKLAPLRMDAAPHAAERATGAVRRLDQPRE